MKQISFTNLSTFNRLPDNQTMKIHITKVVIIIAAFETAIATERSQHLRARRLQCTRCEDSINGVSACEGLIGNVKCGSCIGEEACVDVEYAVIAKDACLGEYACAESSAVAIGEGSCVGPSACEGMEESSVGSDSCLAGSACDGVEESIIGNSRAVGRPTMMRAKDRLSISTQSPAKRPQRPWAYKSQSYVANRNQ